VDFFRILNNAGTILAFIIILIVLWALWPYLADLVSVAHRIHDFAR
jgi:hypothetical protein